MPDALSAGPVTKAVSQAPAQAPTVSPQLVAKHHDVDAQALHIAQYARKSGKDHPGKAPFSANQPKN